MATGVKFAEGLQTSRLAGVGALARSALLAGSAGLAALLLGGFPVWAARRILYPVSTEPLHAALELPEGESLPAEPVRFSNAKNQELSGWFVPGPQGTTAPWPTILLVHGYAGYKEQMATYAAALRKGGFASLMFDMQGSGLRRGQPVTLGFRERHDVAGAFLYLQSRHDVDRERIGVLGVSMGAATALLAAAELPAIKAVVSDSSYADLDSMVRPGLQAFIGPLATAFAPLILWHAERIAGTTTSNVVPERAASQLGGRPLFIVHGETDDLIPVESARRLQRAASGPVQVWTVPDCTHAQAPSVAAEEYTRRVNEFFQQALDVQPPA
jgi:fermentation-respiration switch protein FrsA (DUF1100 family)